MFGRLIAPIIFFTSLAGLVFLIGGILAFLLHDRIDLEIKNASYIINDLQKNPLIFENNFEIPPGLKKYTDFEDEGHLLIAGYFMKEQKNGIHLVRLSDGKLLKTWYPDPQAIRAKSDYKAFRPPQRFEPQSPLLMEDGGIVFVDTEGPLVRIDACADIAWVAGYHFHHSIERDLDGNFIVPGVIPWTAGDDRAPYPFRDDAIATISPDGKLLGLKSVTTMLLDSGYQALHATVYPRLNDPVHLNDIEVARFSTANWQRGDLVLSSRPLHTIFVYRPSTGRIIWLQTGPWLAQHDPDFMSDGRIGLFGNDTLLSAETEDKLLYGYSDIYIVDPATGEVEQPYTAVMKKHRIGTPSEGRSQILANGDVFIEETDYGRMVRISEEGLVWSFHNSDGEYFGTLNWSRYLPPGSLDGIDLSRECTNR